MNGFSKLISIASKLAFDPHRIGHLLNKTGRYEERLDREFPFVIRLFRFQAGEFTQGLTWHERLELFLPLDGKCSLRMGEQRVDLIRGDILVVDNLKLHRVLDNSDLDTRVIVISFLPEFVYSLGSPSHDYTFLLPFYSKVETYPHVMHRTDYLAEDVYGALGRLLDCYFASHQNHYHHAGCKAFFLQVLYHLSRHFEASETLKSEFILQQALSLRLKRLFDYIQAHYSDRLTVSKAASMANLSKPQFTRVFKRVAGMTFVQYMNHVRLSHAIRLLRESEQSIAEIASTHGFSDQSYFDRQFRKSFGKSPREFRLGVKQDRAI